MILSVSQVASYERVGYVTPIDVLMPAESSYYYQNFTAVRNALGNEANPHDIRQPQLHFRWAYELATHPLVVAAVEDLIGPDILLCRGTFFWKDAHSRAFYPYHQDAYGLGFDAHAARLFVTAWIALTDSTAQSGCMKVIPGSHK